MVIAIIVGCVSDVTRQLDVAVGGVSVFVYLGRLPRCFSTLLSTLTFSCARREFLSKDRNEFLPVKIFLDFFELLLSAMNTLIHIKIAVLSRLWKHNYFAGVNVTLMLPCVLVHGPVSMRVRAYQKQISPLRCPQD